MEIIKKDEMPKNLKKPGGTCDLRIEMRGGPNNGEVTSKKILLSWSVSNVKNLFSKTLKMPIKNQKISFKERENSEEEPLEDEHKPLTFYNITDQSTIILEYIP